MVSMVLMVSTSVCGTDRIGSNPFRHPNIIWRGTQVGEEGSLLNC